MERKIFNKNIQIRQHDKKDCAAACLASVSAFYGLKLPMITFRDACGTNEDGASIAGIIDASFKIGLDAIGLRSTQKKLSDLKDGRKPLILHLEKKNGWLHFIVLYDLDDKKATVMDPETGDMQKVDIAEIEQEWSGYVVAIAPTPQFSRGDFSTKVGKRYREIFMKHKKQLLAMLAASVAVIIATLSTSVFLQKIIDEVLPASDMDSLVKLAVIMAALVVATWIISTLRSVLLLRTSLRIDYSLIMQYFQKIFTLPISFFDSRSTGELNARISDAYRIRSFITGRMLIIAVSVITMLIAILLLGSYNMQLTLMLMCVIPVYILLYVLSRKRFKRYNKAIIESNARFEETNIENLTSARAIIYFNAADDAISRIRKEYKAAADALYKGGLFSSFISSSTDCISRITTLVILVAGSVLIISSYLSIGELASFFTMSSLFTAPIGMLIQSTKEITEARISAERIFDIIDIKNDTPSEEEGHIKFDRTGAIRIQDVCFSFPGRRMLLDHFNAEIRPGEINLIRGSNGCGKSTLAAMLMRGYRPDSGVISVGDTDIARIPLKQWREYITIVPQRPDIFNGTILDNIIMGDKGYTVEAVLAACALAGLSGTLENIPGGIMAHTGESACRLSGGERQKIAIARALYRRPQTIILDEATSHLDQASRDAVHETIITMKEHGITVIMISHSEKDAMLADHIIELKKPNAQTGA